MAEAVRRQRNRSKKVVKSKCEEDKTLTQNKENDKLDELLDEYGDTPIPEVEVWKEGLCLEQEEEQKDQGTKHPLSSHANEDKEETCESKASNNSTGEALEEETVENGSELDENTASSREKKEGECTVPSAPSFGELQHQLTKIDPYFEAQRQLKDLAVADTELCVPQSLYMNSDSKLQHNVVNHSVERDGSVLVDGESINVQPSVPMLEEIEGHMDNRTVLEEGITDETSEHEPAAKTKITISEECDVEPMTEIQLSALYQNHELEENEAFIAHFIDQERNTPHLEFYELVLGYLRARTNLMGIQKELSIIQEDYERQKKNIWVFEKRTVTEEGECEDGALLTIKHEYEVACFKEEISEHVSKLLKQMRELLGNSYALHSYEAEMCKLQVENYMQKVLSDCKAFTELSRNAKVCGASSLREHRPQLHPHVEKLHICISVLFAFQRRGVKDHQFVRDSRQWLTDLVAVLLRVASRNDHLFLLNHVLRCPAGVGTWAPSYIQVGGEWKHDSSSGMLGCWPVDHAVTILSTIVNPISAREDFLHHIKHTALPDGGSREGGGGQDGTDNVWVVVDSSGEEEEDPAKLWAAFTENDVIQILNQVPFKEVFQHMLLVEEEDGMGAPQYDVTQTSHRGLLKLFAFARCLIELFHRGLTTYSQLRYRGATKRLCRLLRHTVEYVTDHWQGCLAAHQQHSSPPSLALAAPQWAALQVEYDQLFEVAVDSIFSSPRSGAWQFLAVIPYGSVSLVRLWKIVYKLHVGMKKESIEAASKNTANRTANQWAELVGHPDTRGQFHDCLLNLEENEGFYLLSALANMTVTRESTESEFIQVVVSNIFEAAFVNEGTREALCRNGRDLLATVASTHPIIMSHLLTTTQEKIMHLGNMALYLFRALPIEVWRPSEDDVTCISHWLLFMPPASVENQLARIILSKLNWGENEAKTKLFLSQELHQKVALTVLEAHLKICRDLYSGNLLTEGVKQVTAVMYTPAPEKVFFLWSWEMLTRLRLHRLDQPEPLVHGALACPASLLVDMPDPTSITITKASMMHVVKRGIMDKKPLALYAALLMTTWGHSLPEICEHGVECMHELVVQGRCEAVIHALGHITPLFFSQPEDLTTNMKFMLAIQKCLAADQSYITLAKSLVTTAPPGRILTLFAAMIVHHIKEHKRYSFVSGAPAVRFWLQMLIGVPEWVHNCSVLFLLDIICQQAFGHPICWQEVLRAFSEVMKSPEYQHTGGGGVFGLLSWLTAGTTAPNSLLVRPSAPQYPWYTITVLMLETQQEIASGLWKNLLVEIFNHPDNGLEQALKKVQSDLGLGPVSSSLLNIYRWGQQVVDLPADHPALPLTLQMYFLLHLARVPPQPGKYECCSIVSQFYQGYVNSLFLGKIKKKVASCAEHLESCLSKQQEQDDDDKPVNPQLSAMARLVRGMQAWLEEERLYEPGVYLPALPPHLLPHYLVQIFQGNWEPWPEAINHIAIEEDSQNLLKVWWQHRNESGIGSASPSTSPQHTTQQNPPKRTEHRDFREAILKRLGTYEPPQPPPPVPPRSPLHTPHLQDKTLMDQDALLSHILHYTDQVVEHSHAVNMWCKELCALDCVYREGLPHLWFNANTKTVHTAKCKPPKVGRQQPECSGEASIVLEFSEARLNERENARIEQNREQSEVVVQQCLKPPPLQLCQAAVSLEAIIITLVNRFRKARYKESKQTIFQLLTSGRQVFYHIVQLISEDTGSYLPAKQLIASCAEVLGQEFVNGHGDCQEKLVCEVLEWGGQVGGLLAPHFTPSITSTATFLSLYTSLGRHASVSPDHTFMLLSKFDVENWLTTTQPSAKECSRLVESVGAALCALLPQPQPSMLLVLELYRVHLKSLLNHKFPQHYNEVLNILLQVSASTQEDCGGVSAGLWYDLINSLGVGVACFVPDMEHHAVVQAIRGYVQYETRLSQPMVEDTLKMLSDYFVKQRLEFGLYGLYPKYRLHIQPMSVYLSLLSHTYIVTTLHKRTGTLQEDVVQKVWRTVEGVWAGWVAPLGGRERQTCPAWLRHLTQDVQLLLPWAPSDANSADTMVAMFAASVDYMHELLPGQSSVLSLLLEYYSSTFAVREVKSHVVVVIHTHLAALPWHHLHPSLQDTLILCKVVEQYLPECHSFIGQVLVQVNWSKVLEAVMTHPTTNTASTTATKASQGKVSSECNVATDQVAARLHTCLLNLLVRISMEPSVRQSPLLQTLLLESERFAWWLIDGDSFQRVVNWWVMSCDPRIVLSLPDRNPVDISIIQLLHRSAGYTPDTISFHSDTATKRALLVRAVVRLVTTAAARHKVLLTSRPAVFAATIRGALTHMENTLVSTVPREQLWGEGCVLSTELLAVVSGGASSAALQELSSTAVVEWLATEPHPSPGLLLPLLASASRSILHLNHRNPILQAGLLALFSHEWCGWESEVTWPRVLSLLSFPLTNPAAMLTLAAQNGHLLVVYAHTRWRQQQQQSLTCSDIIFLLTSLCDMLPTLVLSSEMETGLILVVSEILKLITKLLHEKSTVESAWQHCQSLTSHLAVWAEDHCTTGILAAIGLGRQSPMSLRFRLVCRVLATFLNLQMPQEGVFRTHPLQPHSDVDGLQKSGGGRSETCTLNQLRALTTNSAYSSFTRPITQAIQFLEDPGNCLADVHVLLGHLVSELHQNPVLQHLREATAPSPYSTEASAPPPPP